MDARRGTEVVVRELVVAHLRASYEDLAAAADGADVLVSHPLTFAIPMIAEQRGMPWASTVLSPISFFSRYDVPVPPPAPWIKRFDRIPGVARALAGMARAATAEWTRPVQDLRADLALPAGANPLFEGQHSPHLGLALFSRVLALPQPDWPRAVRVVGHVFYNGPASSQAHLDPELAEFLDAGAAPAVFTLGSSAVSAAGSFYEVSAAAASALGVRAVLLVGPHQENRPRQPLPANVIAVEYAPHDAVFARASVIVHHGGIGTLAQAMRTGHPMVIVPFSHDQPDNAYRAARLGISRTVPPRRYTAPRATRALRTVLDDPSYARSARAVAQIVRAEDGLALACESIIGLARR
jgi:rhamnosyltransferase subunit B